MDNSESDSYNKNDMQEKMNVLVRLHEAMQERLKTASYSEPIQILTSAMTHSVCVCSAHQNVVLLVDAMGGDLTYKNVIKLTLSCPKYFH